MSCVRLDKIGMSIETFLNGRDLDLAHDGYIIGQPVLTSGMFHFEITMGPHSRLHPFTIGRHKEVEAMSKSGQANQYRMCIDLTRGVPAYPRNSAQFLRVANFGHVSLYELGLVNRNGGFVVFEEIQRGRCYNNRGNLSCPAFNYWPSLISLLEDVTWGEVLAFPPFTTYQAPPLSPCEELPDQQGQCEWFRVLKGEGCVTFYLALYKINALVRWHNIVTQNRLALLKPGDIVKWGRMNMIGDPRSPFRQEIVSVQLI